MRLPGNTLFELITVIAISGWLLNIISYFYGRKREREEKKHDLIKEYYPALVKNIRLSFQNMDTKFVKGVSDEGDAFFEVLDEMDVDGTLKIIDVIDSTLYPDLKSILTEIIPAYNDLIQRREEVFESVEEAWVNWISENTVEIPVSDIPKFKQRFMQATIWSVWREDRDSKLRFIDNFEKTFVLNEGGVHGLSYQKKGEILDLCDSLVDIAEQVFEPVKRDYARFNFILITHVKESVLPRMEERLSELGS